MKRLANVFITAATTVAMLTSTCPTAAIAAEILPSSESVSAASAGANSAEQATASSTDASDSDAGSTAGAGATTSEDSAAFGSETSNNAEPANASSEAATDGKATTDSAANSATSAGADESANAAAVEESTAAASSIDAADESTLATVELNAENDFTLETWSDGVDAATADGNEVSDTAQSVLAKVLDAYESCDSCIKFDSKTDKITVADVRAAMALAFASAEYYWASTSYKLSYYDANNSGEADDDEIAAVIYFNYYFDASEVPAVKTATEAKIAEALSWIDEDEMSDFEVAQALHDYIVRTCVYDLTAETSTGPTISHSAYGALTKGTAVCQGYALAYKLLLSRAGVPCVFVISENMNHAWNMVQVGGSWYHVDATWDDPVYSDGTDAGFDVDVSHTYFLRADSTMKNSLNHYGWEAAYTTPSSDYSNRTYAEYKAPVSTTGSGSGESSGGNEPSEASTDEHVYAHSDTATQGSITLTVQWDDPVLGEPTTFHVSATGGTGSYKYYMAAPAYSSTGEWSFSSVPDPSRGEYTTYSDVCESKDFAFTMTASGTYFYKFYVMDMGEQPYKTLNTRTYVTVADDVHPSVASIVSSAVKQAKAATDGSDYEMALWLHDWLLDQLEYDDSLTWASAEAALTRHTGTCQAYTNAYIKLLNAAGITNSETRDTYDGHTWNAVKLDGEWYQVDCTWDDNDDTKYYGFDARHLYFGLTDELMAVAHKGHAKIYTASGYATRSTSLADNYYVKSGLANQWADAYATRIQAKLDTKTTTFSISSDNANNPPSIIGIQNAIVAYAMSQRTWTASDGTKAELISASEVNVESNSKWTAVYNFIAFYDGAATSIAAANVKAADQTYTGSALTPSPVVKLNGISLKEGTDYTVSYSDNTNAGTATVTITGIGHFADTASDTFAIKATDLSKATVKADDQTYTGSALTPEPTVTLNGTALKKDTDYTASYSNNTNAGTATVTVTGSGNYTGTAKGTFKINAADASKAVVKAPGQTYSGSAQKPAATVTLNGKALSAGKDYDISYANNVNAGTATVTAKFKGNYSGTASDTFTISALNASKATVKVASQTYTGKALTPAPTVTFNGKALKQGTDYTASYANNTKVGTATVAVTFKGNYTGSTKGTFAINEKAAPNVVYQAHVQNIGWQTAVRNGATAGTSGRSLRVETVKLWLENAQYSGGIQIRAHVQNIGWQNWSTTGGTSGKSLRVEAMQIRLTGELANHYDVYYRVHAQNFGWMGWAKNGNKAGSSGYSYRLEAVQIKIVKKGAAAPGSTANAFRKPAMSVQYQAHVQNIGWQGVASNGATAGTSGRSLRVEALNVSIANGDYDGGIQIRTHVQNIGWQNWSSSGGTSGQGLRLEAMRLRLTGELANHYDVYYRVHAQNFGWMGWAKNGEQAGTSGYSCRLEAIQIKLVPKGSAAPGSTANRFRSR